MNCQIKAWGLILCVALFSGCADYNLCQSVWLNDSSVEKADIKGDLIRVLHFSSVDSVELYCLVRNDTGFIVSPFKYADGVYAQSGNPRKEANVVMKLTNTEGESLLFHGMYRRADAMILMSNDMTVRVFGRWKTSKTK